ncbi:PAS domain-containing protein [Pleomorphomonas sp. JP5]|uniref:sensor histidine kinase n=1 Tax=Pleomorphomonas sp. JP5 TaxID=2942998 RepID=UPI002044AC3D|nr:PAS domain-containing protein [Pleomorphomonas sp. JP5]MCM5557325.1 PAS domain-containing protein [Pleomorphomonas sp. JP5]
MFSKLAADDLDLRDLFNASANAYVIFTRELMIAGCNDAYLKAVGRDSRDEIIGQHLFEAFPADPASDGYRILTASFDRVLKTDQPDHVALVPYDTSRPGEPPALRFWSATHTPLRNKDGELAYILQHTQDVTELQLLRERDARANMAESGVLARAQAVQTVSDKLSGEIALLRELFEQAPGFIAVLTGPTHVFQLANDAYRRLVGRSNLVGLSLAEALPEVVGQGFTDILDEVWRTGEPFSGQDMPVFLRWGGMPDPELRHVDFVYQPIRDAQGEMTGIFVQGHDVTERWRAQRDLERQTELLRLAQEGGGFGTYDWDFQRRTVRGSRLFHDLLRLPETMEDVPIVEVLNRIHPDDATRLIGLAADSAVGADVEMPGELRLLIDDRITWIGARGTVVRDDQGRPERVLGAVQDLTQRKQIEERLDMVARESAHRVKNILTIIQIITENTLRRAPSIEAARQSLGDRIAALNKAQIRILAGPGDSRLDGIVRDAFAVTYQLDDRIVIEADRDAELAPRTGLGLALALHELITNAMKYGALSTPDGKVRIGWTLTPCPEGEGARVNLDWRETGGPPVVAGGDKGFGSKLIRNSLAHDSMGRADWTADPDGVRCQFVFSAKAIVADHETGDGDRQDQQP